MGTTLGDGLRSGTGRAPSSPFTRRVSIALILAATFVVYIGTLTFGFVYDDHQQIVLNPLLRSWRFVPYYFFHDVWSQRSIAEVSNYYRPVFLLWLRANYALFALKPAGWHMTSVLLHVLTTWLVYRLALKVLQSNWQAGLAATLFGLNPIHLEAVAWVSGSNEPLMASLLLGSFLCYLQWHERTTNRWPLIAVSLFLFLLASLAKETALILPFLVFGYEWFYAAAHAQRFMDRANAATLRALPYLFAALCYMGMRLDVLRAVGRAMTSIPWRVVVLTWPSVLWFYARLLVWPAGLSVYYDNPYVVHPGFGNFAVPLAWLTAVIAALAWWSCRSRAAALASLWLSLPLLPVLDFRVFGRGDIAHDRYLYLPSVGLAILLALLISRFKIGGGLLAGRPAGQILAAAAILGVLGVETVRQSAYWANDIVLCYHGMTIAPRNAYARNTLGVAMMNREDWGRAEALFHEAIDRDPDFADPYTNLALLYYKTGRFLMSEQYTRQALRLDAYDAGDYFLLGVNELQLGRLKQAEGFIRYAISLQPRGFGFHFGLGVTLRQEGNLEGALREFRSEPADSPKDAEARQQISEIETLIRSREINRSKDHDFLPGTQAGQKGDSPASRP